jgi:DNA repair protein RecO (recombination protein O)
MLVQERAILLSKTKYGEADLILKVLTANGEVYSAIAKSALKSKKRFGGGILEPTHYLNVTLLRRDADKTGDERMAVLNEAQLVDDFPGLKKSYDRLELAFHFVKAVAMVAREGDAHREVFNLLGHALKATELAQNLSLLKIRFNLKLLHAHGVLPPDERFAPFLRTSIRSELDGEDPLAGLDLRDINREVEHVFANYVS